MRRQRYSISTVQIRGILFDRWLLRLEKKAFGWVYYGTETEDHQSLEVSSTRAWISHTYVDWLEFRRCTPFSKNILFMLTEILSKIWSFIRRIVLAIGGPLFILFIVALLIGLGCGESDLVSTGWDVIKMIALIYALGIALPSLLFVGLGFLWRAVFKIDKKLSQDLADNGYDDDIFNCD